MLVTQSCPTLCNPWTVVCQAPLSTGFSSQEYWIGLSFSSPGNLPNPGIKPRSTSLQVDYHLSHQGNLLFLYIAKKGLVFPTRNKWSLIESVIYLFIYFIRRLISLQYCSGFCHTLTWISHGFTYIPHPNPPSHLPLYPIPLGYPSNPVEALVSCIQPGLVICFTLDNIHVLMLFSQNIPPSPSPTGSKSLFYTSVSLFLFCM